MHIEPIQATLGATVTGVNLNALDNDQWQAIEAAWYEYAVLVFPGSILRRKRILRWANVLVRWKS